MARRRRAYRGTPEQHRKTAVQWARVMRVAVGNVRAESSVNDCYSAMLQFQNAAVAAGRYMGNADWFKAKTNRQHKGRSSVSLAYSELGKAQRAFLKCLRGRKG